MCDIQLRIATKATECDSCGEEIFVGKPFLLDIHPGESSFHFCSVECSHEQHGEYNEK